MTTTPTNTTTRPKKFITPAVRRQRAADRATRAAAKREAIAEKVSAWELAYFRHKQAVLAAPGGAKAAPAHAENQAAVGTSKRAGDAANRQLARDIVKAARMEPADWQAKHSPTTADTIATRDTAGRKIVEKVKRRRLDARLADGMLPRHEAAAESIDRAIRLLTGELRSHSAAAELRSRGTDTPDDGRQQREARLIRAYRDWLAECRRVGQMVGAVIVRSVLIDGASMREAERQTRQRNGTGKPLMLAALDLFADLNPRLVGV